MVVIKFNITMIRMQSSAGCFGSATAKETQKTFFQHWQLVSGYANGEY